MEIKFEKFQGAGNDFIILDNRDSIYSYLNFEQIKTICNRNLGVGSDGLILLESSIDSDFEMKYFNSDGTLSSLCGNGGRCIVAYAHKHGLIGIHTRYNAVDGFHEAQVISNNQVRLKMNDISNIMHFDKALVLDSGSPHYVEFNNDISKLNVKKLGRKIRKFEAFNPDGINVNFIQKENERKFFIRTYERGVENETLACGTGAVAAAVGMHYLGKTAGETKIELLALGGRLIVDFSCNNKTYENIHLQGPANYVFSGIFKI